MPAATTRPRRYVVTAVVGSAKVRYKRNQYRVKALTWKRMAHVLASRRSARLCRAAHCRWTCMHMCVRACMCVRASLFLLMSPLPLFSLSSRSISSRRSTSLVFWVTRTSYIIGPHFLDLLSTRITSLRVREWATSEKERERKRERAGARVTIETFVNSIFVRSFIRSFLPSFLHATLLCRRLGSDFLSPSDAPVPAPASLPASQPATPSPRTNDAPLTVAPRERARARVRKRERRGDSRSFDFRQRDTGFFFDIRVLR